MNSKTTWRLFFAAAALFAFIIFVERREPRQNATAGPPTIFPKMAASSVIGVEIQMTNLVVRADRTNDVWRLTRPFYPAQSTPIDMFVEKLLSLPKADVISASDVAAQPGRLRDYGLEPPVAVLSLSAGSNRFLLNLGAPTVVRDQVYAQVPGSAEVLVTDASIWKAIPPSVNAWRSPMLVQLEARPFDHIQIRSGQRQLEFARDTTNRIWRISKPTPARANNLRISELLQQLETTRVKEFVLDSPTADLERYGLQTPELELSLALDTNRVMALEFGASPTNDPGSVYVRRVSTTNIVLVGKELLEALSLPYKAYHDPRLISVDPQQLTMIQVRGTNAFTLVRGTNGWTITEPSVMRADVMLVKAFLTNLSEMTIENFAKDVPTEADLKQFGLAPPQITYALFGPSTSTTNAPALQLDFGIPAADGMVYARRTDETPVYLSPDVSFMLPSAGWQLRDRQIFDFPATNVIAITVSTAGRTNRLARQGQLWSANEVVNAAREDTIFRLAKLQVRNWAFRGTQRLAYYGVTTNSVKVELEVAGAQPAPITFGKPAMRNNIYAATVLPGDVEPTFFEFPGDLYQTLMNAFVGQ